MEEGRHYDFGGQVMLSSGAIITQDKLVNFAYSGAVMTHD